MVGETVIAKRTVKLQEAKSKSEPMSYKKQC
jgi:hypothetical protein